MSAVTKRGPAPLTTAIRTLEQLLRNHMISMETEEAPVPQAKASRGSFRSKVSRKTSKQKLSEDETANVESAQRKDKETVGQIDWDSYWDPRLSIANGIGDMKYTVTYSLHRNDGGGEGGGGRGEGGGGGAVVHEHRHCQGQFFEFMELNKFPFDSQDLSVNVTTDRSTDELEFVADEVDPSGVNTGAFSAEQEWRLDDKVNVWKKTTTKGKTRIPSIYVAAKASRRPQFFIYNIIIIMFSISSLAFSTFTVKLETPESRLPLTFILVLTTVTFKFVVNKSLPKISYLTYLDKYILGSMMILCMVCIWHALAGSVVCLSTANPPAAPTTTPNPSTAIPFTVHSNSTTSSSSDPGCPKKAKCVASATATNIDYIALGFLGTIYIGFHIVFLVLINCHGRDDGPNEEIDLGDDDADDNWKKEGKEEAEGEEEEERRSRHLHQQQLQQQSHHVNGIKDKVLIALEEKRNGAAGVLPPSSTRPDNSALDAKAKGRSLPAVD